MLIFHDLSRKSEYPTVAALGFFDGVHLGPVSYTHLTLPTT